MRPSTRAGSTSGGQRRPPGIVHDEQPGAVRLAASDFRRWVLWHLNGRAIWSNAAVRAARVHQRDVTSANDTHGGHRQGAAKGKEWRDFLADGSESHGHAAATPGQGRLRLVQLEIGVKVTVRDGKGQKSVQVGRLYGGHRVASFSRSVFEVLGLILKRRLPRMKFIARRLQLQCRRGAAAPHDSPIRLRECDALTHAVPASAPLAQAAPTPTPLSLDDLSAIQPGLGTVMLEYGRRMALVWMAEKAGNWDLAHYQILEMREIQETGEITRPARATALKSFESSFLDPLDAAVVSKDATQFDASYRAAIQGCNSCHGSQTSADFPQGFGFIKVQVPATGDPDTIYAYAP